LLLTGLSLSRNRRAAGPVNFVFVSRAEECAVTVSNFPIPQVTKESTVRAAQLFLLVALFFIALEIASAQPPAKPAELKVLDRLAGKWRFEWESKPTELDPKGSKGSGTSTNEWILDGWFQQHKGKLEDGHEILEIWTYDEKTKTYRAWGFIGPGGGRYEGTGTWDEKSKTLTYKGKGPGDVTFVSTMRFIDNDNREATRVATDPAGKVVQDALFKMTRQK
jgi:hypothetical protein